MCKIISCLLILLCLSSYSLSFYFQPIIKRNKLALSNENIQLPETSMSIDEIKAELDMRGVDFQDCISKSELVQRLVETRVNGKANPDILKSIKEPEIDIKDVDDNIFDQAVSKDGNLPGGMSKDMLKALTSDQDIMRMLQDPKMQDIMSAVMSGTNMIITIILQYK